MKTTFIKRVFLFVLFVVLESCSSCNESGNSDKKISGVFVTNPSARSCDVLLEEITDKAELTIEFSTSIQGQFQRKFPRLAISLVNTTDSPFTGELVSIYSENPNQAQQIISADCYDKNGVVLEDSGVLIR